MHSSSDRTGPRAKVLALLRRHGWNTTSFQLVEPDFLYWFDGDDACVAYVETSRARVVAGAPVCAPSFMPAVAARFVEECTRDGKRVVFFAVESRFLAAVDMHSMPIGEQPIWQPPMWVAKLRAHRSLREQLRRSRAKGVTVQRVENDALENGTLRRELESLLVRWIESRPMPRMAFLVDLDPFSFAAERRYYVATIDGRTCGLLVAVPVYGRNGWFLEDVIRDPAAPNGTVELMIDRAMRDCAAEGSDSVTFGLAPLAGDVGILRHARALLSAFYSFDGLRAFKAKLRPDWWEPVYLAVPHGRSLTVAVYDALSAFARGHPFAFAVRATFRASSFMLRALAFLLVPWMVLLALPAARRFFPGETVRWAWIAFDGGLVVALLSLSRRWRPWLAAACAVALAADFALTLMQFLTFNARRIRGVADALLTVSAVIAPAVAAAFVAGGMRRRRLRRGNEGDAMSGDSSAR